ncbi:MAG: alpha,alpha-phosphotrehalase [Neisseriaceae bacterium]|nr:MAG: alpha,alpha-phosphotrehalase [Neisseriaceae bacterium]
MTQQWWKNSVVYQIYPKSFKSSGDSPTGDLKGIINKLDYLQKLGVDVLWLTPVYASPQRDNGYDISDYYSIDPSYGTLADMQELLTQAHSRGLKVIMDIVVNHTSTAHHWFQEALRDPSSQYYNYYIWRDSNNGKPPTNWLSKFGGSSWQFARETGQYYLHLFDVTQADLNWENPLLRSEIYAMMRWWLDMGVDGFRLDVINLISKEQTFLDDTLDTPSSDGRKYYTDGPKIHDYLKEMNREVFRYKDRIITVGEMSSTSIANCIRYTNPAEHELDMIFSFHHLKVDYAEGNKWSIMQYDFLQLKKIISDWQLQMQAGNGWNALFWSNHDQPRALSRFGDDKNYPYQSATMLATALHCMRGTPYIYQGEEIGMTNPQFSSLEDYRDVESINAYNLMTSDWDYSHAEAMAILAQKSRDNARTPMQWDDSQHAGFTSGIPWIRAADNYSQINVANALADKNSIFYYYQRLIQLRKEYQVIADGEIRFYQLEHPQLLVYSRHWRDESVLVVCNFSAKNCALELSSLDLALTQTLNVMLTNDSNNQVTQKVVKLAPFGCVVLRDF